MKPEGVKAEREATWTEVKFEIMKFTGRGAESLVNRSEDSALFLLTSYCRR